MDYETLLTRVEEIAGRLETWRPTDLAPLGVLFYAGKADAYADAAVMLRVLVAEATPRG